VAFGEVGVDVEVIRPVPEMADLVERYFSASERNAFASLAPGLQLKAFFSCWTRKEAFVKASGEGLAIPLDQFDVSLDPTLPARLIGARGVSGHALDWDLHNLDLSADTVGALVCQRNSSLRFLGRVT
jgi:4'-phosphopantetheinyl transferase